LHHGSVVQQWRTALLDGRRISGSARISGDRTISKCSFPSALVDFRVAD
jgi:hypothetical protein